MKITELEITPDLHDGLKPGRMTKLQKIVLLAGPNGAGKSRLLARLKNLVQHQMPLEQYNYRLKQIENLKLLIERKPDKDNDNRQRNIQEHERALEIHYRLKLDNPLTASLVCVDFVPKKLDLDDCNNFSKSQLLNAANNASKAGMENLPSSTLAKIQTIQNQWWEVTHPASSIPQEQKEEIIEQYDRLKQYIFLFLKTDLDRNSDGDAMDCGDLSGEIVA
jgi:energy-coupling factor transporter ATP-binding protein EcfA2